MPNRCTENILFIHFLVTQSREVPLFDFRTGTTQQTPLRRDRTFPFLYHFHFLESIAWIFSLIIRHPLQPPWQHKSTLPFHSESEKMQEHDVGKLLPNASSEDQLKHKAIHPSLPGEPDLWLLPCPHKLVIVPLFDLTSILVWTTNGRPNYRLSDLKTSFSC